jgi:S1 RNA binding domain protein
MSLDDKISKFLKESDERMQPIKNRLEQKKRRNNPS